MKHKTRRLAAAGVVGAVYAVVTLVLAPISFGPVQFRVSEALCALAFFDGIYAFGLFAGCFLANLVSSAGVLDVVFGSLATLAACLAMTALGRRGSSVGRCLLACLMPVVFNGVIVGAVLAGAYAAGRAFGPYFLLCAGEVAAGEAGVMLLLGYPLLRLLPKKESLRPYLFDKQKNGE